MYKKRYAMFYFSVTFCLIVGCFGSGLSDWRYELPNIPKILENDRENYLQNKKYMIEFL
jgi:hypothetical protein